MNSDATVPVLTSKRRRFVEEYLHDMNATQADIRRKDRVQIGETRKLRLSDRMRRLELIGKHIRFKAFEETVNVKGLDTLADRLERAHRQAAATHPIKGV
ncbi:hypothetical protein [Bradyrhizobium sp. OAE829]|uniref:hypothetical protein n=1 Tax=Bradyrhizobium sp. OAE829 TaxID=2663807 RepID=UPI00178B143D